MGVRKHEILTPTAGITDYAKKIISPKKQQKLLSFSYA
jgi:hypothetical protein